MMTLIVFAVIVLFRSRAEKAFKTIRPIFRERGKINAEVTGRLTESLGGVRVIKGYHAEEREAASSRAGVQRLLDNVMQIADGDVADVALGHGADGNCRRADDVSGERTRSCAGKMTLGDYLQFTMLLAFMIAPVFEIVNIGTQMTEALAGLERTREVLSRERTRMPTATRTVTSGRDSGR